MLRLALIATGIVLACSACNLLPASGTDHGTAQATVTYQDDSGTQQSEVSVGAIFCDVTRGTGAFLTVGEDTGQIVMATAAEGEPLALTIALGHDGMVFRSTELFKIGDDGAEFSNLQGEVVRTDEGEAAVVDLDATATGTIT